jgi:hypothetical protein
MADPQAVEEIRRILLMNVGIRDNRPSAANVKVEIFQCSALISN